MSFKAYTIEECCDILNNLRFPLNSEQRFDMQGEFAYYGANGVQGYINQWRFDDDLILIAEDGGNFEQYATRPIAYRVSGKCWVNNHAHVLKAKEKYSQNFIFYSLQHKNILYFIAGGTRSKLTQGELKKIIINHPKKDEADKIAQILSKADAAITQTETLIAKYQRIKTGLMQDLLTRGIDEHGNIRSKATHRFAVKKGILVPEEWEVKSLGRIADFKSGFAFRFEQLREAGWKVVRISNLHKPDFPYWHYDGPVKDSWIVVDGDILFTWAGISTSIDCIKYHGEPAILNQHIYNIKFENEIVKEYTYRYLQYFLPKLRMEIEGGAGQLHLTKDKIEAIKIPFMKNPEMEMINQKLTEVDKQIIVSNRQLSKLQSLKTGLMQDLLSGKVRVKIKEETLVNT